DERLMPQTDAEGRPAGQPHHDLERVSRPARPPRARRDDEVGGTETFSLVRVDLVVPANDDLDALLGNHVREVVGKAVVVVDEQNHRRASASSIARSMAASLFRHSSCSSPGTESATIPAPAWRCATPSASTIVLIAMHVSSEPPGSE